MWLSLRITDKDKKYLSGVDKVIKDKNQFRFLLFLIPAIICIFVTSTYNLISFFILFTLISFVLLSYGIISFIKIIKTNKNSSFTADTSINEKTTKEILKSWLVPLLAVIGGGLSGIIALVVYLSLKL